MENAMILLYDLCRLCLDEPGINNIFQPVDWSQDILTHTGLKLSTDDNMPQTICASCRDIINSVKILKEIALGNHKQLLAICNGTIDPKEVFVNASASHLVFLSSVHQNDKEHAEITSTLVSNNTPFKDRITFENDKTASDRRNEKHANKRKCSSKPDSSVAKLAVRKDLFDSPSHVTSSTKSSKPRSTRDSSPRKDPDKKTTHSHMQTSSTKSSKPGSTRDLSPRNDPDKKTTHSHVSTSKRQSPTTTGGERQVKFEFECEICHKNYATAKKLYLHHLSHNKKFICPIDVCEKKFASKGDLRKHVRSHTGERPFKCDLCDQSFTQNVSLKAHRVNIHNDAS